MEISTFGILNILSGIDTPVLNKKIEPQNEGVQMALGHVIQV